LIFFVIFVMSNAFIGIMFLNHKKFKIMHWSERLKTVIKLDEQYLTRNGVKVKIIDKRTDNKGTDFYEVIVISGYSYLKEYMVNKFGGFGIYANHYDLVKKCI